MISRMNFVFLAPFLLFAVVGAGKIIETQNNFRECRDFLDEYATTDCQRVQNIHLCTQMLNGQIKSRGNQEINRLKCTEDVQGCKTTSIQICKDTSPNSCSDLHSMKECLYQQDCTKHFELLDKYYTDGCLKTNCNSSDVTACDKSPTNTEKNAECRNLDDEYSCVLRRRSYTNYICKMPTEWQKKYDDNDCERLCHKTPKPTLTGETDDQKCKTLKAYKSNLNNKNCKIPDDMESEYKALKCDTRCPKNYLVCTANVDDDYGRKKNCERLSYAVECSKNTVCPTSQKTHDLYAFYGCDTSCNGIEYSKCTNTLKEPLNSTRDEQCGYYKEYLDCAEKSKCEVDEGYNKLLECNGAASRNIMFSIIILALLTVQMLERYISLS
ncbi:uncharacterized protein LOC115213072 [Octopus sinensis]|uniref:Uncharacterized protein LOC115213072 n=1 Tax=Octopus sinensis TaxID=2607531 RepID=A0A6P7SHI3_9MOLL|nr:uncharacterized protein LOC115213072 [Octopus sinensis]